MSFVITLSDSAAQEPYPVWPGQPVTAQWGMPDPGNAPDLDRSFRDAFYALARRISLFLGLPLASLSTSAIKQEVDRIAAL